MKLNNYTIKIPNPLNFNPNNLPHERTNSDLAKKKLPTTIISSPTSSYVYINTEISNDYQNCIGELNTSNNKKKSYLASVKSITFDRKNDSHIKSRPQTAYKNFLLKSHTPKASGNFEFIESENKKSLISERKINMNQEKIYYIDKIKESLFYIKNDEIISNLKFFEKMKNSCKLNFYSVYETVNKLPKNNELPYNNEDVYNLILVNLKKLEIEYMPLFLNNQIVSEETVQHLLEELNEFLSVLIKKILLNDQFFAISFENFFKFFLIFLEKVIENNRKKINEEIKNEMIKYKNENQILMNKIQELEQTIKSNGNKYLAQKKEMLEVQIKLKKENFDYTSQINDLQNKIEEMLNPEAIEDNSYTMKAKCESLMRFVNKIEAYNEEQTYIFSKGIKELFKEGFHKNAIKVTKKSTLLIDEAEDSAKKFYNLAELINVEFRSPVVFDHSFNFYLIKNFANIKCSNFLDKPSPFEIGLILDAFLSKIDCENGIPLQNPASLFIEHMLLNFENSFNVSFKLTAICDYLKSKSETKNDFFVFYSRLLGLMKYEMISNENFYWLVLFRKNIQKIIKKDQISYADPEKPVYFQIKDYEDVIDQTFAENESFKQIIQNKFQAQKKEMEVAKKESRKKIYYNITSSQDFPLITTLLERFKLHDVWEVIDNLNKILTKMDKKNTGIIKYKDICSFFENEFSINPNQAAFEKYFKNHINFEKDEFSYKDFIESMIEIHIDNKDNENKISYYEMMSFLCDSIDNIEKNSKEDLKKRVMDFYKSDKLFNYLLFKNLFEDYIDSEFIPLLYKFSLGENHFQKMFDKHKKNIKSSNFDPQIIIRTQELDYPHFHDKEKTLKNIMNALENLKIMSSCINSGSKKIKFKDHNLNRNRKNSQTFSRKSTLKKPDRKKSNAKLNLRTSYDKESPTFISEDTSEYDSPSLSPQKSRVSIFIKKKISEDK